MSVFWTVGADALDPQRLARFWALALDYVLEPGDGPDSATVVDPDGRGPAVGFLRVPEAKTAKNRVHLDVRVSRGADDAAREQLIRAKAQQLVDAGAVLEREERYDGVFGHLVLTDPEGNEFCVA